MIQVRNPYMWHVPFVQRAMRSMPCAPEDIDFAAVIDAYEIWLVMDPLPSALAILSFNNGPLRGIPSVVHFYSEGTLEARKALMARGVARIKEEGYDRFLTGNWTGRDDEPWCRLFSGGGQFEKVGSMFVGRVGA